MPLGLVLKMGKNTTTKQGLNLLLALLLCTPLSLSAQRGRKASVSPPLSLEHTLSKAQTLYQDYELDEACSLIAKLKASLERGRKAIPETLTELEGKILRAQKILPRTERTELIQVVRIPIKELPTALEAHMPRLSSVLQLNIHEGKLQSSSYHSPLGNAYLMGRQDSTGSRILTADFPEELWEGQDIGLEGANFPFLMPDGITLILGKLAPQGLGGYDLYISRYNWSRGLFLEPSLLGMPYNSPSNDYLLAYDDEADKTLLISDRACAEGEIALYILKGIPSSLSGKSNEHYELTLQEAIPLARLEQKSNNPNHE